MADFQAANHAVTLFQATSDDTSGSEFQVKAAAVRSKQTNK